MRVNLQSCISMLYLCACMHLCVCVCVCVCVCFHACVVFVTVHAYASVFVFASVSICECGRRCCARPGEEEGSACGMDVCVDSSTVSVGSVWSHTRLCCPSSPCTRSTPSINSREVLIQTNSLRFRLILYSHNHYCVLTLQTNNTPSLFTSSRSMLFIPARLTK